MTNAVRCDNNLPTLRVTVGAVAGTRSQATFEVVGLTDRPYEIARCPLNELGLPPAAEQLSATAEQAFRVPRNVLNLIKSAVAELGPSPLPPQQALWLDLHGPRGYLYVLPWERMLAPLGRPILRRPQHTLRPVASASALSVGLCVSASATAPRLEPLPMLQQLRWIYPARSGRQVTVHVFTDPGSVARTREFAEDFTPGFDAPVVVHDPSPALNPTATGDPTLLRDPWLRWIRDALQGTALDVLHFVGHGYLDRDRGEIALGGTRPSGSANEIARYAGAPEMLSLIAQVGAWCLALTGPAGNRSPAGLRELADAVSLTAPCVTLVHELGDDDAQLSQLGDAVATIMGHAPADLGPLPAVTCYAQPQFLSCPQADQEQRNLTEQGNSSFIDDMTHSVIARDDTPAWVASATRTVESLQAKWSPREEGAAMNADAKQALESVASLVRKHVEDAAQPPEGIVDPQMRKHIEGGI